ncbi:prepilin-type N-terminal cleavage/methylation domain-containing protein [Bacillota bacterium LX-D]|nr:prepilin-type N-terminal cleavage/methylation domain-containing protein [Bacillota bacterium LX-D]
MSIFRTNRGFTLLELMLTTALLGIFFSIIYGFLNYNFKFLNWTAKEQGDFLELRTVLSEIVEELQQYEEIAYKDAVTIQVDSGRQPDLKLTAYLKKATTIRNIKCQPQNDATILIMIEGGEGLKLSTKVRTSRHNSAQNSLPPPPAINYEPASYAIYTNKLVLNNNGEIKFDLFMGTADLGNNIRLDGTVYYKNYVDLPADVKKVQDDNFIDVEFLKLYDEGWYKNNGFNLYNENDHFELKDNQKYYIKGNYTVNIKEDGHLENVTIVCTGNVTFNDTNNKNKYEGQNVWIIAPNGSVTFKNNCRQTGIIIAKQVEAKNNFYFDYQEYPEPEELPYQIITKGVN